jgi:transcription termination factor Rho
METLDLYRFAEAVSPASPGASIPAIGKVERGGMDLVTACDLFSFYLPKIFWGEAKNWRECGNCTIDL